MKINRAGLVVSALLLIGLMKVLFFFAQNKYGLISVGGTSDADYYDSIALGTLLDPNPWGQFLKFLNGLGLYDRPRVAFGVALLNAAVVPWLFYKIIANTKIGSMSLVELLAVVFVSVYPTVMYYTTDIYRDIPMIVIFLVGVLIVKCLIERGGVALSRGVAVQAVLLLACVAVLYVLRFYLAAAMVIALIACFLFDLSKNVLVPLGLFVLTFTLADSVGVFNWMKIDYRLTYAAAGSGFGIDFSQGSFWINFMDSLVKGLYGFYFKTRLSIVMFVVESLPVLLATAYVAVNRKCIDKFAGFLLIFFVAYASIWVIGVDSLGTAARYRVFNYLAIMLAACVVYRNKQRLLVGSDRSGPNGE
jgi:hypothetical protein